MSATYASPPVDQKPSTVKYYMKRSFAMIYWRALGGSLEWLFDIFFGQTRFPAPEKEEQEKLLVAPVAAEGGEHGA